MFLNSRIKIGKNELGLVYQERDFSSVLEPGVHKRFNPLGRLSFHVIDVREPFLPEHRSDDLIRSGLLDDRISVVDVGDTQRALVWIDGRFSNMLGPGQHAYFHTHREVRVEIVEISSVRFDHQALQTIIRVPAHKNHLDVITIRRDHVALLEVDGRYVETLAPGIHAFWKAMGNIKWSTVDMREQTMEISGQEIMTSDKVSLRLNAQLSFRVTDAIAAETTTENFAQAIYREAQLALRAWVGTRSLDDVLSDKDSLAASVKESLLSRAGSMGLEVSAFGIRDVILPGDMKELMNRVMESRKAAEANLIARREETAAIRSQANTAKILADNPTLMRLRELEVLEKVAASGNLNVVLGEQGLADRVVNLM